MYIGSVHAAAEDMWVLRDGRMRRQAGMRVPGLLKLFDEILVNAADNRQRDAATSRVDVTVDPVSGRVTIENDGRGIPVELHPNEEMYVPELVLGNLLTGSNFKDDGGLTGGRHGYGAKLTNIFSKEFQIDTGDATRRLRYTQTWTDNMQAVAEPAISKLPAKGKHFTKVSFVPDFPRFGLDGWTSDALGELERRTYDIAACNPGLVVTWNGTPVDVASWEHYVSLYADSLPAHQGKRKGATAPFLATNAGERWKVGVMPSLTGQFEQVSFVNSMHTSRGGTHVNAVTDAVVNALYDTLSKRHKSAGITKKSVKANLCLFVSALIENPEFDSQAKEQLTSKSKDFGSTFELPPVFLTTLTSNKPIVDAILKASESTQLAALSRVARAKGRKDALLDVEKLEDANLAGTRHANMCTLVLTEGDSAKALAMAGLSEVGRDKYGVMPLKGKLLNVRDATLATIQKNAEVVNLIRVMGLNFKKTYEDGDISSLRYGRVLIMTDQDQDGSHIKGLVLNMFHHFWPALLKRDGFFAEFVTPLLKARRGKDVHGFFTMQDYDKWWESVPHSDRGKWTTKYYKGLGTSTAAEGREYFRNLDRHVIEFTCGSDDEGNILDLPFSKKRASDRKAWMLRHGLSDNVVDHGSPSLSLTDFVNKELVHFSHMDLQRSIPSVMDGLKPSQRKVLYACTKRAVTREIKVAQLAGYCAETTAYHHGEVSLHSTIVNMAQDFVGSNNLPLLQPIGQFGTRLQGGKDAASPRYIFTQLSPFASLVYRPEDECVLRWRYDDGKRTEPETYLPVIPMALVNGAEGIGTGWSTSIPPHNPVDLVDALLTRLELGDDVADTAATWRRIPKLVPWFKGFTGTVQRARKAPKATSTTASSFQSSGVWTVAERGTTRGKKWVEVEVTELPAKTWTEEYRAHLAKQVSSGAVLEFSEFHTDRDVRFVIRFDESEVGAMLKTKAGTTDLLKLSTTIPMGNIHLIGRDERVVNFKSADALLRHFFTLRKPLYDTRRQVQVAVLEAKALRLREQSRFVANVATGDIELARSSQDKMQRRLVELGFTKSGALHPQLPPSLDWVQLKGTAAHPALEADTTTESVADANPFDYLMRLPLGSLTEDKRAALDSQAQLATTQAAALRAKSAFELWEADLLALRHALAQDAAYEATV